MKRLVQQVSLANTFESISATDLRSRPGEVLQQVELGKTFLIKRNGQPVAVLSKPPGKTLTIFVEPDGSQQYGL